MHWVGAGALGGEKALAAGALEKRSEAEEGAAGNGAACWGALNWLGGAGVGTEKALAEGAPEKRSEAEIGSAGTAS